MRNKDKSPLKIIIISFIILIFLVILLYLLITKYTFKITNYDFDSPKVEAAPIRIIQLSDLHGKSFGRNNRRLINAVTEEAPDLIFMTGDMYGPDEKEYQKTLRLISDLKAVAPVYFALGNHEELYVWENGKDCLAEIQKAGAVLCEKNCIDIDVNGTTVRIGGTIGYALSVDFWEASYGKKAYKSYFDESFEQQRYMLKFEKTDYLKLLLLHRPEGPTLWAKDGWYDVDFVFSGHTHGGIVRIPFVGGLIAPEEKFFPEYDYGVYTVNGVNTIITSGLGNSAVVPRINNIPEIVSITIY